MQNLRNRVINFRVTDEEFERLKSASARQGARCLSDYARSVIFSPNGQSLPLSGFYDERLISLDRRLTILERSLSRLTRALASSDPEPDSAGLRQGP